MLGILSEDRRKGVQHLIKQEQRYLKRLLAEQERTNALYQIEDDLRLQGYHSIAGVDEVGRGPLAGPVVAAAVILPERAITGCMIDDSKKLTPEAREKASRAILAQAVDVQIGVVAPEIIDNINILQASFLAMRTAVEKLTTQPDIILVDGNKKIPAILTQQRAIIKGDAKSRIIAAASIVAKVYRDKLMIEMSHLYPEYCFDQHKGYPTPLHRALLKQFGPTKIHRKSFLGGLSL